MSMLRFASLGSGSSGNATVVVNGNSALMIDCGFSAKEATLRLARLGLSPDDLDAILVTHEHSDHAKGVSVLSRRHGIPAYMSLGTALAASLDTLPTLKVMRAAQHTQIGSFVVEAVTVPHDAREPLQFTLSAGGLRLGVLTDLGSLTPVVTQHYACCDALLVEANHDLDMLANGPYPWHLQQRVRGPWGHLNNLQTAELLASITLDRLQHLVVGHISQKNNSVALVQGALAEHTAPLSSVHYACQDAGFDWLDLN